MDVAALDNSCKKFCLRGDQINRLVLRGVGSWEGFLPGDIVTCLCDVWGEWRREWMVLEGEVVTVGVKSLLARGEGSGASDAGTGLSEGQFASKRARKVEHM